MKRFIFVLLIVGIAHAQPMSVSRDPLAVHIAGTDSQVQLTFDDTDHAPDAVGELLYDNTITGLDDGGLAFYDDDEVQVLVALDSSETLGAGDDTFVVQFNWNAGAGYFNLVANGAGGAFSDAGDPIVQNTTGKDVHLGDGAGTLAGKVEVGGDADQPQLVIEGHSSQTDDLLIIQQDDDTELFSISPSPSIKILEVADAPGDTAGYGQIWVDLATPNTLWFTDDAGTDFQLGTSGATVYNAIGDATGVGSIVFDATETAEYTSAFTANDFMTIKGTGAFGDYSVLTITQDTGNPSDGDLLDIRTADAEDNVDQLKLGNGTDDYMTIRVVEAGTVTFDVVSDGTDAFVFGVGDETIAINSSDWDISATGVATGMGNITSDGYIEFGADPADQGVVRMSNATILAWEDATEATITHVDNVGFLVNLEWEVDGTLDADGVVALGDGGDNFSVASDGIDIDTSGNITNAGTIASGVVTVTGVINTSVGIDAVGAVDFDIGSGDVTDITLLEDGGTYIFDNGFTAVGEDLGSATAEWNDLFLNDGGVIQLGDDQDVTIAHVADTGIQIELDDSIMFGDTAVFIESDDDGYLDLDADTGIRLNATVTTSGTVELGHASDTTIARAAAGSVTIEGQYIVENAASVTSIVGDKLTVTGGVLNVDTRTIRVNMLGWGTLADPNGNAFFEPYSIKATNDVWKRTVLTFNDTATKDGVHGFFHVPKDYVDSANLVVVWTSTATAGDVEWEIDYRSVAIGESADQNTPQENTGSNDTAPGTTDLLQEFDIALTDGNFAAEDIVEFIFYRDGTDGGDTLAAAVTVHHLLFEYQND